MKRVRRLLALSMSVLATLFLAAADAGAQKTQDRMPSSGRSELPDGVTSRPGREGEFSGGGRVGQKGDRGGSAESRKGDRWQSGGSGNSAESRKGDRWQSGGSGRGDRPESGPRRDTVPRAYGYGYGRSTTPKNQDRLPPDRDYRGPVTDYRTIDPPAPRAYGYGYGRSTRPKIQDRLQPQRNYRGPVTDYRTVTPERGGAYRAPSIREMFGNSNGFWNSRRPSPYGHYYNGLYSIGRWDLSAGQAMSKLKADLNRLHPLRAVGINGQGQRVTLGNRFNLTVGGYNNNPVRVIGESDTSFTLWAEPGHTFQGTVKVEVIKDSSGELWLDVEGRGVPMEHPMQQRYNTGFAYGLWRSMATNARTILSQQ